MVEIYRDFVDKRDCDIMIERLNYLIDSGKVVAREDGRVGLINSDDEVFMAFAKKYFNKAVETTQNEYNLYNGYVATKYVSDVGMAMHIDSEVNEELGALMYLNDDYEGGELLYVDPETNEQHSIKVSKGDMVYCPSWYSHGVNKVISGERYFFTVSLLTENVL